MGSRVWGLFSRLEHVQLRVWDAGFRVLGLRFRGLGVAFTATGTDERSEEHALGGVHGGRVLQGGGGRVNGVGCKM